MEGKENQKSGIILGVVVLAILVFLFFGRADKWSLFYYPHGCLGCSKEWIVRIDWYKSKEECLATGEGMRDSYSATFPDRADDTFECGNRCKPAGEPFDGAQSYQCENTYD